MVVGTRSLGGEGVGVISLVWKTPDTALYSIYVSSLWRRLTLSYMKCIYEHQHEQIFRGQGGSS
jgi:hypothetical protein